MVIPWGIRHLMTVWMFDPWKKVAAVNKNEIRGNTAVFRVCLQHCKVLPNYDWVQVFNMTKSISVIFLWKSAYHLKSFIGGFVLLFHVVTFENLLWSYLTEFNECWYCCIFQFLATKNNGCFYKKIECD